MRATHPAAALSLALAAFGVAVVGSPAHAADNGTVFVSSAVEHADHTVTLPLHRGEAAVRRSGTSYWMPRPRRPHSTTA